MIAARLLAVSPVGAALSAAPQKYTYWVQPCTDPASLCQPDDPQLAQWAFEAWQKASGGELEFTRVKDRDQRPHSFVLGLG